LSATTSATLELNGAAPAPAGARPRTVAVRWALAVAHFARRKPLGAIGGMIVLAMLVMAVFAEQIAPYRYDETVRGARMTPPSAAHWLGTDNLSRDMWSRIVYGARVSVTVGFATIALAIVVATAIGVSSAYFGGPWDLVVQRVVLSLLAIGPGGLSDYRAILAHESEMPNNRYFTLAYLLGPGPLNLIVSIAIIATATNSRVIRGATLTVMQSQFVEAARAMGCGHMRIIVRHLLPNVVATIIILATIGLGAVILAESALSFLGFGVPPPYPSWGAMLSGSGRTYMLRAPWMAIWPGVAISLAVFGFNMLGDALRDVLDPRLRGGR